MSKLKKFLSYLNKNQNVKIFYDKSSDILNGKKNLQHIINATKYFCDNNNIYVEIGSYRGFTLIHNSIYNKHTKIIGIDNFSLFDKNGENFKFIKNQIKKFNLNNIKFIKKDFEIANKKIINKIAVLFIDGAHDYRSHLLALLKYSKHMSKEGIIIIDDANYYHVRKATSDFLDINKNFKLLYQKYTNIHIANANFKIKRKLSDGNWNGIHIIYKGNYTVKRNVRLPKFEKEHLIKLFYDTHETFRHKYAFNTKEILDLIYDYKHSIISKNIFIKKIDKLSIPHKLKNQIKFKSQNIFK